MTYKIALFGHSNYGHIGRYLPPNVRVHLFANRNESCWIANIEEAILSAVNQPIERFDTYDDSSPIIDYYIDFSQDRDHGILFINEENKIIHLEYYNELYPFKDAPSLFDILDILIHLFEKDAQFEIYGLFCRGQTDQGNITSYDTQLQEEIKEWEEYERQLKNI